jgi:hypothetical protein
LPRYRAELENTPAWRLQWLHQEREPIAEPVLWREQNVEGIAPNPTLRRIPQWIGITAAMVAATVSSLAILHGSLVPGAGVADVLDALLQLNVRRVTQLIPDAAIGFGVQGIVVMILASMIVGVRCAGAITQERERQTWEALLLTPVSAKQIVRGKLWGIIGAASWYLLAYAAPAVTLSVIGGPLAVTLTLAWLGATLLAMYFIGAAGLWCSARSSNSWRSLLQTMGFGYAGGLLFFALFTPGLIAIFLVFLLILLFVDIPLGTGIPGLCLSNAAYFARLVYLSAATGLVVMFWLMARVFLNRAQRWIADRERTRYWQDVPQYRRSRGEAPPAR